MDVHLALLRYLHCIVLKHFFDGLFHVFNLIYPFNFLTTLNFNDVSKSYFNPNSNDAAEIHLLREESFKTFQWSLIR